MPRPEAEGDAPHDEHAPEVRPPAGLARRFELLVDARTLGVTQPPDPPVSGILLFGGYARGDSRPQGHVDLAVVRDGAFEERIVRRDRVEIEVFENDEEEQGVVAFLRSHRDDVQSFRAAAKVLVERDGATVRRRAASERTRGVAA